MRDSSEGSSFMPPDNLACSHDRLSLGLLAGSTVPSCREHQRRRADGRDIGACRCSRVEADLPNVLPLAEATYCPFLPVRPGLTKFVAPSNVAQVCCLAGAHASDAPCDRRRRSRRCRHGERQVTACPIPSAMMRFPPKVRFAAQLTYKQPFRLRPLSDLDGEGDQAFEARALTKVEQVVE